MDEDVSILVQTIFLCKPFSFANNLLIFSFLQYFADPLIAMEHILDSLKLLDYETSFCKQK